MPYSRLILGLADMTIQGRFEHSYSHSHSHSNSHSHSLFIP
jgi:hypothetical protein